ncbi:hypothetical protein BDW59DRAFT_173005 [Aspergillus cavernicola]|uniref:Histidine phosphatase superfamily n=1 Tax=Aspergillus cavernicola TaxID=176166 RepID=A0ABR4I972_9EURO
MPKRVAFVLALLLHWPKGTHNPTHNTSILDPPLTANGVEQYVTWSRDFTFKDSVGLVLTSPLRRTLQTAVIGFQGCLDGSNYGTEADTQFGVSDHAQLSIEPDLQAHSARPCDKGSDISVLRSEFDYFPWDILACDPTFPSKECLYATDARTLEQRGLRVHRLLQQRFKELEGSSRSNIVVVTHGGFMNFITREKEMGFRPAMPRTFMVSFEEVSRMKLEPVSSA